MARRHTLQTLVDALTREIETAMPWRPGDRLPPQRILARDRGIAASTVSRVYRELARRGLVVGETGRGTYVRAAAPPVAATPIAPSTLSVDLALNVPVLPEQARLLADSLAPLLRNSAAFEAALRPVDVTGTPQARQAATRFLSEPRRGRPRIDPARLIFTASAKQALLAVIAALTKPGDRVATDALTYPMINTISARLHIELVPVPMDEEGMRADLLEAAHLRTPLRAVYCQPTLHNPVGISMSERRRAEIVRVLKRHRVIAIEDAVYSFLAPQHPTLYSTAPDQVVLIDSLSKRLSPGLTAGIIAVPAALIKPVAQSVRAQACGPTGFALAACTRWMTDGTATAISMAKRRDAATRQRVLKTIFTGVRGATLTSGSHAYHAWLTLPAGWRADAFEAAAAAKGIAVLPASAFSVVPGHVPNAVRLALASPTLETLESALTTLATLARQHDPARA